MTTESKTDTTEREHMEGIPTDPDVSVEITPDR